MIEGTGWVGANRRADRTERAELALLRGTTLASQVGA
jgi:hypothetical protein